jgi:hypothetical protein
MEFLLEKCGLLDIINNGDTTEPVKKAVTCDGGSISRFLGHVIGGFTLVDSRCKTPKTGEPLFGDSGHDKVQSHIYYFPI